MVLKILQTIWYPAFLPKCRVVSFTVPGWKLLMLQASSPVVNLRRIKDGKIASIPLDKFKKYWATKENYAIWVARNGYVCVENNLTDFVAVLSS